MARKPKPWFWTQVGEYCVTLRGKRYRLGKEKDIAKLRFPELLKQPKAELPCKSRRVGHADGRLPERPTFKL